MLSILVGRVVHELVRLASKMLVLDGVSKSSKRNTLDVLTQTSSLSVGLYLDLSVETIPV